MKNKKHKHKSKPPIRASKRTVVSAHDIEELLDMPHEEFIRAQKELVEKGLIEIISGDIDSDEVVFKLNFL